MAKTKNLKVQGHFQGPFTYDSGNDAEWLVTNGTGAFASSTIIDCPARKYHGLLVSPLPGKEGRYHILSAVEASPAEDPDFKMATNQYPGAIYPEGFNHIFSFNTLPFPKWIYKKGELEITKEVFMVQGESSVFLAFTLLEGGEALELDLKMLFTFRDANYTTHENLALSKGIKLFEDGFEIQPYGSLPFCGIRFSGSWKRSEKWYWDRNIEYPIEQQRGLDFSEDRFVPGDIRITLRKGESHIIQFSLEERENRDLNNVYSELMADSCKKDENIETPRQFLKEMGSRFFVKNSLGGRSINAGFPWFGEWGRDTMIALPGLTFCSGRTDEGLSILSDYAALIRDGLLPNTLGESQGFTSYNSMDAGLLYCWAVKKLLDLFSVGKRPSKTLNKKQNTRLETEIVPAVHSIVSAFAECRAPNARLEQSGLLNTGGPDSQLTWMDARAWGKAVTPRHGLAVDLNALWYDSLATLKRLSELFNKKIPDFVTPLLEKVRTNFTETFLVRDVEGRPLYLSDTVVDGEKDYKIRPNMLFASSAAPGLLSADIQKAVVEMARAELLTCMGMRTLSPGDSDFAALYRGNADERDSVYHQGTVWPWPLGIMVESSLMTSGDLDKEVFFWEEYFKTLLEKHLYRQGVGFVSEIFDGLNPQDGKGCFAQAWSTGEILRALDLIDQAAIQ